jgi:hypothetical protein
MVRGLPCRGATARNDNGSRGGRVGYDTTGDDCGCDFIVHAEVDGRQVEQHHHWPDDGAPHSETSECGCGPQLRQLTATLWVYDHVDQDEAYLDVPVMAAGVAAY